jgi:hypothetical protein
MPRVIEIIAREDLFDEAQLDFTIIEVKHYIRNVEVDWMQIMAERSQPNEMNPDEALFFFRSRERLDNSKFLLQYLLSFVDRLPLQPDLAGDIANPFAQFKSFVQFQIALLKEEDVAKAIMQEYTSLGLVNEANRWYYDFKLSEKFDELGKLVEGACIATVDAYFQLFDALQRLSLFWFEIRGDNIRRVRKSDMYIYKLAQILMMKYGPGIRKGA